MRAGVNPGRIGTYAGVGDCNMENKRVKAAVMLTCFNRKEKTVNCIRTIVEGNPEMDFLFIVADDASTDGTKAALQKLPYEIVVLDGNGSLFWNGGMRMSLSYALKMDGRDSFDCFMLVNDDVSFLPGTITSLYKRMCAYGPCVGTGAMRTEVDSTQVEIDPMQAEIDSMQAEVGVMTYGGIRRTSKFFVKYEHIKPSDEIVTCDSFNGNCVILPADIFIKIGNLDPKYVHSMSDFDYGFMVTKAGIPIINSKEYTGICSDNEVTNSWRDASLPRKKRLALKNSPKGLPTGDWFHFVRKNYGFVSAVYHFLTPYVRILIGK